MKNKRKLKKLLLHILNQFNIFLSMDQNFFYQTVEVVKEIRSGLTGDCTPGQILKHAPIT